MDGRKLKSINQYWNKRKPDSKALPPSKGRRRRTSSVSREETQFRMQDFTKTARYIVDFCIDHQIGTLVCGYNRDFKRGLKLGKVTISISLKSA